MFKIAIICGGPSFERGISLNSARSLLDHLSDECIQIIPLYVDWEKNFYALSEAQLYSNTPADFDFKLFQTAKALGNVELKALLQSVNLVFPVIHGPFGEDGELQKILEEMNVPFVGSSSASCKKMYFKDAAASVLKASGFNTLDALVIRKGEEATIEAFVAARNLKRFVIKPVAGGSSIGVASCSDVHEGVLWAQNLFQKGHETVLLEPFCEGKEFTVVVLQGKALPPTEIETSYDNNAIFDYRKKYLPTTSTAYHTPPRFPVEVTEEIQKEAEKIFDLFEMRDFIRIDGWLMNDGSLYFTDINPISGLEQNSFFFRQASLIGLSHKQALQCVVKSASDRYGLHFNKLDNLLTVEKKPVFVLFGGKNAERQVSLMSGTNVWLKLLKSNHFTPSPYFFDQEDSIWEMPYHTILNHTVEEIHQNCRESKTLHQMSLKDFLSHAKESNAFVFIALHGGVGEDGTLQKTLEEYELSYNGSDSTTSRLCMDKYETGQVISGMHHQDILSLSKKKITLQDPTIWHTVTNELGSSELIIKPCSDGCSAGIVLLKSEQDFERYCFFVKAGVRHIPAGTFPNQKGMIEMSPFPESDYLLEPYIETDTITVDKGQLKHTVKHGWIELTVGVLEEKGCYKALNPSITIAEGAVLSLEEKFQGGTGINITPPPTVIIPIESQHEIKQLIEEAAKALKIKNYTRIDIFFNTITQKMIVIEANTLPGLTPSTVIYHQALAENPPISPTAFLENLIFSKLKSTARS